MSVRSIGELLHAFGNSTSGVTHIVPAVANQRVYVYRMILTTGTPAVTLTFEDTGDNDISQNFQLAANGSIVLDTPINGDPWWATGTGLGLDLEQSGTSTVSYDIWYLQGP